MDLFKKAVSSISVAVTVLSLTKHQLVRFRDSRLRTAPIFPLEFVDRVVEKHRESRRAKFQVSAAGGTQDCCTESIARVKHCFYNTSTSSPLYFPFRKQPMAFLTVGAILNSSPYIYHNLEHTTNTNTYPISNYQQRNY